MWSGRSSGQRPCGHIRFGSSTSSPISAADAESARSCTLRTLTDRSLPASAAAASNAPSQTDANELHHREQRPNGKQDEAGPVAQEAERERAGGRPQHDQDPQPRAFDFKTLYASTMASIASATSLARNGMPRTRLKPVASTRNSARISFRSWPRLISGTSTLS